MDIYKQFIRIFKVINCSCSYGPHEVFSIIHKPIKGDWYIIRKFLKKNIYILGTIDIAPITEKIRMWVIKFNKLVQLSQGNSLGSYWIICSWLFTIHFASLLCARENFWRAHFVSCLGMRARLFPFFRADMNLVCTKCNGARVSVWWTRAHKCDGWSYINMIDGCKETYKKCARTQILYVGAQT